MTTKTSNDGHGSTLPQHLDDSDLISYLDGESTRDEQSQAAAHLESCWDCRSRLTAVENSIDRFLELRRESLLPQDLPPAGPALAQFQKRLSHHALQTQHNSVLRQLTSQWLACKYSSSSWSKYIRLLNQPIPIRVAVAFVVSVLIVLFLFRSNRVQTVSASELLQRAAAFESQQLSATAQPVIYQKLQVRSRRTYSSSEESVRWEIWNDTTGARLRQAVDDEQGTHFVSVGSNEVPSTAPLTVVQLTKVLQSNGMNPQRPLSPESFQSWRNSLNSKQEKVSQSIASDGAEILTLKTAVGSSVDIGRITEASLTVRARDWHPIEEHLHIRAGDGEQEYTLTETAFDIVSLQVLDPAIFSPVLAASTATPNTSSIATPSPKLSANVNALPLTVTRPVASAELEVEVLDLLNQAGADLGEQVTARRTTDGTLMVDGVVETDARKAEILRSLAPVADNPAVRIEINTVAEALRKRDKSRNLPPAATEQRVEINSNAIPAAGELRSYFKSDHEARQFAARMVAKSQSAMRHLYALRRLSMQFSPTELRALAPEARQKWLALIRSHARSYLQEIGGLRHELQPVFSVSAPPAVTDSGPAINDPAELVHAVERLFELGSVSDRVILSAFTASSEASKVTAIKSTTFWRSLNGAEALALRIQSAQ
jgi:anti-sigma factor RsiW